MITKIIIWVYFIASLAVMTTFGFPLSQTPDQDKGGFRQSGVDKTQVTFDGGGPQQFQQLKAPVTKVVPLHQKELYLRLFYKNDLTHIGAFSDIARNHHVIESIGSKDDQKALSNDKKGAQNDQTVFLDQSAPKHCKCDIATFKDALAQLNAPDFTFKPSKVGDPPQTFAITDTNTIGNVCGLADLSSLCEMLEFKFYIEDTSYQITQFPYKGFSWEKSGLQLSLNPTSDTDLGDHSVILIICLKYHPSMSKILKISFNIAPTSREHRQLPGVSGYCTGPTTNLNLLNTGAFASQSDFMPGYNSNSNQGCDGITSWDGQNQKQVYADVKEAKYWWAAALSSSVKIQSVLVIGQNSGYIKVGNDATNNYLNNPQCATVGTPGTGWYTCGNTGIYLSYSTGTNTIRFAEIMAYSQEAIHIKAKSATLSSDSGSTLDLGKGYTCMVSVNCKTVNLIRSVLKTQSSGTGGAACCAISGVQKDPFLEVALNADVLIDAVILTPIDKAFATSMQKNVEVYITNPAGEQSLCGTLTDYNTYQEVPCNKVGNKIVVKRPGDNIDLALAGVSILSSCDCSKTSFDPTLIFHANASVPFASPTTINTLKTGPTVIITFNKNLPDTVSCVCGNADGFSKCQTRVLIFKDKIQNNEEITNSTWPFKGFKYDYHKNEMLLDPAKLQDKFVMTVTLQLVNFPTVTYSQDITVTFEGGTDITVKVEGGTPAPTPPPTTPPPPLPSPPSPPTPPTPTPLLTDPVQVAAPFVETARVVAAPPVPQLKILPMTLNAKINQQTSLQLPQIDGTYSIVNQPTFVASIYGNELKVLTSNVQDVGTQYLDLVAKSLVVQETFKVKIIFTSSLNSPSKTATSAQDSAVSTSSVQAGAVSKPSVDTQSAENSEQSQTELVSQLEKVVCNEDGACVDPTNSRFSCYFDEETGKMICGVDLVKKTNTRGKTKKYDPDVKIPPTMIVSQVDSEGCFTMKFSQRMDVSKLINQNLSIIESERSKEAGANLKNKTDFSKYLLSTKHIKITIQPNSDQDFSKLQFEWVVINITEREIKIQVLFKNPTFISQDFSSPDYLVIQLLSGFLVVKSKSTNLIIINPLRTVKKRLPNQLVLGAITETVQEAASTIKTASEAFVIGNFILSVFLSGALGTMYHMINSFQMLMSYSYLVVPMPANVTMVMLHINTIASFDYLPTDTLFGYLFAFSATEEPFATFQAMGVENPRLSPYLGTIFFVFALLFVQSVFYLSLWPFKTTVTFALRYYRMMREKYYWRGIIRLVLESYSDMCVGILLSWRETRFENVSDAFDLVLTFIITLIVIGGPILSYLLMLKYANELDGQRFQLTYGSLTEGYLTTGVLGCQRTRYMILWFLLRRLVTALAIVLLGDQSPVWQIATLMYLSLADVLVNYHLNAYESKVGSFMSKINDFIVFFISYFPFVYSGLVLNPDDRYDIGWFQLSLIGFMFMANVSIVIHNAVVCIMKEFRRVKAEKFNLEKLRSLGYVVTIVVETIWQKLARLCQVEWVFYDSRPERLNVQIAPHIERYRQRYAEFLVDQLDELAFYEKEQAKNAAQLVPVSVSQQNEEVRIRQSQRFEVSEDRSTLEQSTTSHGGFIQRLTKNRIVVSIEQVSLQNPKVNSPIQEEINREVMPLNETIAQRLKRKWLNADRAEVRGNQVAQLIASPQTTFKSRPKKEVFIPVKVIKESDNGQVQIVKRSKEDQVILCLQEIKANKQKMTVSLTAFAGLLPEKFLDLNFEAQLEEVKFLYNYLTETATPQRKMELERDSNLQIEPTSDIFNMAEEEEMQAKPCKKPMILE